MGYDPFATTAGASAQGQPGSTPDRGALVSDIYARQLKRYLPSFANIPDADVPRVVRNILALPPERKAKFFEDVRRNVPRFRTQGNPEQEFTRLFAPEAITPLSQRDPIDVVIEDAMAGRGGSTWGMGIGDLVPPQFPRPQQPSNINAVAGAEVGTERMPQTTLPEPVRPTAIRPLGSDPTATLEKMLKTAQRVEADTAPVTDPVQRLVEERAAKTRDSLDELKKKRALGAGIEESRKQRLAMALSGAGQMRPLGSELFEGMRAAGDPSQWQTMPGEIQVLPEMAVTGDPTGVLPAIQAPMSEQEMNALAPGVAARADKAQAEADAKREADLQQMDQLIGALETGVYAPILNMGMPIAEGAKRAYNGIQRYRMAQAQGDWTEMARGMAQTVLGAGGAAIASVPMVAGVNAMTPLTTAGGGRIGEVLGGEEGRKIGEKIGEYAPLLAFGARGLALMGGSMAAGAGAEELLSMPWAKNIPEEDKQTLIEAAGHAGFLAGMAGMRYKNAAARSLFVKEVERNYTPQQLRDVYLRVNRGEGTPSEEAFTRALNTEMGKDIGQAVRSGVTVSSEQYRRGTPGWLKAMAGPVREGERIAVSQRNGAQSPAPVNAPEAAGTEQARNAELPPQLIGERAAAGVPELVGPNILPPDAPLGPVPGPNGTPMRPVGGPASAMTPSQASGAPTMSGLPPQLAQFFQQMMFPQRMPKPEAAKPKEEAPKQLPAMDRQQMRQFMTTQADILQRARIPEEDIPDYAQDSLADGKKLRSYAEEVIAGQLTPEAAATRVRADYDAMINGRKEAPNLEAAGAVEMKPETKEPVTPVTSDAATPSKGNEREVETPAAKQPSRTPDNTRWGGGREPVAAIPGEPIDFIDANEDQTEYRGSITEIDTYGDEPKYAAEIDGRVLVDQSGKPIQFSTADAARVAVEDALQSQAPRARSERGEKAPAPSAAIQDVTPEGFGPKESDDEPEPNIQHRLRGETTDQAIERLVGYQVENGRAKIEETRDGWVVSVPTGDGGMQKFRSFKRDQALAQAFTTLYPNTKIAESADEDVPQEAESAVKRKQHGDALREVAEASREPVPEIVPVRRVLGSDGKWYPVQGGMPRGVSPTNEYKLEGYAYRSKDGTTFGNIGKTPEELTERWNARQDESVANFERELQDMSPHELDQQSQYWRKRPFGKPAAAQPPSPAAPSGPQPDDAPVVRTGEATAGKQRRFELNVPYPERYTAKKAGAKWDSKIKKWVFTGTALPLELRKYAPEDAGEPVAAPEQPAAEPPKKTPAGGPEWEPAEWIEAGPQGFGRSRKWTVETPRGKVEVEYDGDKWGSRFTFIGAGIDGVKTSRVAVSNRKKYESPADAAEKLIAEYQAKSKKNAEVAAEGPREVRHSPEFIKSQFKSRNDFMQGPNWYASGVRTLRNAALKGIPFTIEADEVTDYGGKLVLRIANQRTPLTKGKVNENDLGLYLGAKAGIYGPVNAPKEAPPPAEKREAVDFILRKEDEPFSKTGYIYRAYRADTGEPYRGVSAETAADLRTKLIDERGIDGVGDFTIDDATAGGRKTPAAAKNQAQPPMVADTAPSQKAMWEMPWREFLAAKKVTPGEMLQARRDYVESVRGAQKEGRAVSTKVITDVESVENYLAANESIQAGGSAISPKAPAQEKPSAEVPKPPAAAAPPRAAEEKPAAKKASAAPSEETRGAVYDLGLDELKTDEERFQNRMAAFSEKTAATIAERFNKNLFDPIVVWKDPADGETYVLSGHSRLEGMKRRNADTIPARYFDGTEAEAIEFAKLEANRLGTSETFKETVSAYKQAVRSGYSKGRLSDLFGSNEIEYLAAVSHLNPDGMFLEMLNQGASSEFPYLKRFSRWVGELRREYREQMTNAHEQQIFDFLYKTDRKNIDIKKDAFDHLIAKQLDAVDFKPSQPLILKRSSEIVTGTRARKDTAATEARLQELKGDLANARTPEEQLVIQKEIDRLRELLREVVRSQGDMFGETWEDVAGGAIELTKDGGKLKDVENDLGKFFAGNTPGVGERVATYSVRGEEIRRSRVAFEELPSGIREQLVQHALSLFELGYRTEAELGDALAARLGENVRPVARATFEAVRAIEKKLDLERSLALRGENVKPTQRPGIQLANGARLPVPRDIIPAGKYGKELDEHQRLGANMALTRFSAEPGSAFGLFDGQGTGKTRIILATAAEWSARSGKPSLIIAPSRQVIEQAYAGDGRALGVQLKNLEIGTYDDLRTGKIGRGEYGLVVFDEAHFLKNTHSARSEAAERVVADHRMYATGTPMDRPTAASYFLAHLTGLPEAEIQRRLGYEIIEQRLSNGEVKRYAQTLRGLTWPAVWNNVKKLRNEMIESGAMIRREFPFFGTFDTAVIPSNPKDAVEQNEIDAYWQAIIARYPPHAKKNPAGQRIGELSRWNEPRKLDWVYDAIQKDLADGRSVVVIAEGVNETEFKSIKESRPGFLSELSKRLRAAGVKHAQVYGDANKAVEIRKFQSGSVRVAIGTPGSAGTGVSMDDATGDAPRTMYVVTQNWSGDLADQMLYRVSRRNTVTPARIVFVRAEGALADMRRTQVVDSKIRTLEAIQQGADPDEAAGWHPEQDGAAPDAAAQPRMFSADVPEADLERMNTSDLVADTKAMLERELSGVREAGSSYDAEEPARRERKAAISAWLSGKSYTSPGLPTDHALFGSTSKLARHFGITAMPLIANRRKASESMDRHDAGHDLTAEEYEQIPALLDAPIQVFSTPLYPSRLIYHIDIDRGARPMLAIVDYDGRIDGTPVQVLVSAYSKEAARILNEWTLDGRLVFRNEAKAAAWYQKAKTVVPSVPTRGKKKPQGQNGGVQFPWSNYEAVLNIRSDGAFVKYQDDNQQNKVSGSETEKPLSTLGAEQSRYVSQGASGNILTGQNSVKLPSIEERRAAKQFKKRITDLKTSVERKNAEHDKLWKEFEAGKDVARKIEKLEAEIADAIDELAKLLGTSGVAEPRVGQRLMRQEDAASAVAPMGEVRYVDERISEMLKDRVVLAPIITPRGVEYKARELYRGIQTEFEVAKTATLLGRYIATPADLAQFAQHFRRPDIEVFRVFGYDANGKCVVAQAITSRSINTVAVDGSFRRDVVKLFEQNGVVSYDLLHNHPSGTLVASNADMVLTGGMRSDIPGPWKLRSHIVTNHGKYVEIRIGESDAEIPDDVSSVVDVERYRVLPGLDDEGNIIGHGVFEPGEREPVAEFEGLNSLQKAKDYVKSRADRLEPVLATVKPLVKVPDFNTNEASIRNPIVGDARYVESPEDLAMIGKLLENTARKMDIIGLSSSGRVVAVVEVDKSIIADPPAFDEIVERMIKGGAHGVSVVGTGWDPRDHAFLRSRVFHQDLVDVVDSEDGSSIRADLPYLDTSRVSQPPQLERVAEPLPQEDMFGVSDERPRGQAPFAQPKATEDSLRRRLGRLKEERAQLLRYRDELRKPKGDQAERMKLLAKLRPRIANLDREIAQITQRLDRGLFEPDDLQESLFEPGARYSTEKTDSRERDEADNDAREPKDLVALHNLGSDELAKALDLGGLPVPSLAVVRKGIAHSSNGDVTLVGTRDLVDPQVSGNRTYDSDIYSPTFPEIRNKVNRKGLRKFIDLMGKMADQVGDRVMIGIGYEPEKVTSRDAFTSTVLRSRAAQAIFLRERGEAIEIPQQPKHRTLDGITDDPALGKWIDEHMSGPYVNLSDAEMAQLEKILYRALVRWNQKLPKGIREKYGFTVPRMIMQQSGSRWEIGPNATDRLYSDRKARTEKVTDENALDELLEKKLSEQPNGAFESWVETHMNGVFGDAYIPQGNRKLPYTLDNIVAVMKAQGIKAAEGTIVHGLGKARAMGANEFRSIEEMRAAKGSIQSPEVYNAQREEAKKAFFAMADLFEGTSDTFAGGMEKLDDLSRAIGTYIGNRGRGAEHALRVNHLGRNLQKHKVDEFRRVANLLADAAVPYFESKPQRGVAFREFAGAVVPESTPQALIERLSKAGIAQILTYPAGDEAARQDAVKRIAESTTNVLFSKTKERNLSDQAMRDILAGLPPEFVERIEQDPNSRDRGFYNPITDEIVTRMENGTATLHELGHRFWLRYAPTEMHNALVGLVGNMDRIIGKKAANDIRASYPRNEWAFEMEAEMFRQVAEQKEWAWTRARAFAGRLFRLFPKAFRRWGIDTIAKMLFGAYRLAQRALSVLGQAGAKHRAAIAEFLAGKRAYGKHDPAVRRPQSRLSENVMVRLAEHGRRIYGEGKQTMGEFIEELAQAYGDQIRPYGAAIYRRTVETLSRGGQLGLFEREYAIPAETRLKAFQRAWQDRFNRMLTVEKAIAEQGGTVVRGENPYTAEELHYGKIETRLEDFEKEHVEPLKKALATAQKAGVSLEDVSEYLYAVHAPDRNAQIAKINPEMPDGGSGMYNEEARQIIERMRSEGKVGPELEAAAREVWRINKAARDIIRGNLESTETVDAWEEMYGEHYVPLRTGETDHLGAQADKAVPTMGTGRGFSVTRSGVKRALGRRSLAGNIIEHSLQQYVNAVIRDEKNKVGRAFLEMVLANPDRTLWEISKVPMKRVLTHDGIVAQVPDWNKTFSDEYFRVTVDGEVKFVHIKDPVLARQLKRLYEGDLVGEYGRAIVNGLGRFTRFITVINTAMNPEFLFVNFVRDAQAAGVNMSADGLGKLVGKVAAATPRAIAGIASAEFRNGTGEWASWYDRFKRAGGKVAFFKMDQVAEIQQKLIADVNALALSKAENVLRHPWRTLARPFVDGITKMNSAVENGVRLAAFRTLVESKVPEAVAASYAKNMTVNFNRKGELGPIMNSLYAFFNAGVQGQARMAQTLRSRMGKQIAIGMLLAGMLWSELQRWIGGDDEDGLNRYDKVDPYVKSTNFIIMLPASMRKPGGPEYVKMPLPYGFGLFYSLGAEMNAVAHGKPVLSRSMDDGEWVDGALPDFLSALATHVNPLGNGPLVQVLTPTAAEPFMQLYTNENFFGAPIRPEPKSWDDPKPASEMYFQNARPASRWIARKVNEVSGGDEFKPGYVSVSPNDIDFVFDIITGGAGKFWFNTAQMLGNLLTGEGTPVENTPIARRFVGREREAATRNRFYSIFDEFRRLDSQADALRNDEIRYQEFLQENARFVEFAKALNDRPHDDLRIPRRLDWVQRDVSRLGREEKQARKDGNHAQADKLHQQQMRIMKEVIRLHNQYMEPK